MKLIGIIDTDTVNYKKISMVLEFPYCSFKCDRECGKKVCQNSDLASAPIIDIKIDEIIKMYNNNPMTEAIICQGLEPMDSIYDLFNFIEKFREQSQDDIVIYTGYKKEEIPHIVKQLMNYPNIVIKFGRFIPDDQYHYDDVLGVNLASMNQYAERIS
jgi:hypothetical protein